MSFEYMPINNPHSYILLLGVAVLVNNTVGIIFVKMGKKSVFRVQYSVLYEHSNVSWLFPAHSRHIQGGVDGSFSMEQACF